MTCEVQFIVETVADLVNLQYLPVDQTTVILNQSMRGGVFVFHSGNFSTQVAADPGQGIYVAPQGNPTGAQGAWVRLYHGAVDFVWWGAVPDGVVTDPFGTPVIVSGTDNTQALSNWNVWATYESSLGNGVVVEPSPGTYLWNGGYTGPPYFNGFDWLVGIKRLYIRGGHSAVFQNTYNQSISGPSFAKSLPWPVTSNGLDGPGGPLGFFINQTVVGATSLTCTTAAEAGNFTAGEWAMIGSLDVQYSGFPFNLQQFQFVQIATVNASTGVITIKQPIIHEHRTDYPDFSLSGPQFKCGKARIWLLNQFDDWDIDHTYDGVTCNLPPGGGQTYATFIGREIRTIDWRGCGFSETELSACTHVRPQVFTAGETDKLIESITYYDADNSETGLSLQSVHPARMTIIGGRWGSITGCGKNMYVTNSQISQLQLGSTYGLNEGAIFDECLIENFINGNWYDGAQPLPFTNIDGVKRTYANGVITVDLVAAGFEFAFDHAVPGQILVLEANASTAGPNYPGEQGIGFVLSISATASTFIITTTFPYATLPAWATGNVYFLTQGPSEFRNCTGSDAVRVASEATKIGLPYFSRSRFSFAGLFAAAGNFLNGSGGAVSEITVDVIQPSTTGAAELALQFFTADATTYVNDTGGTVVTINHGVKGKRVITTTSFTGKTGTDGITVGGAPSSFFPTNRVLWIEGSYTIPTPATLLDAPLIDVDIVLDFSLIGKRITRNFATNVGVLFDTQGLLP